MNLTASEKRKLAAASPEVQAALLVAALKNIIVRVHQNGAWMIPNILGYNYYPASDVALIKYINSH